MPRKMQDIARPGDGDRKPRRAREASTQEHENPSVSPGEAHAEPQSAPEDADTERVNHAGKTVSDPLSHEAARSEDSSVRSFEARNAKREQNQFLKKMHERRSQGKTEPEEDWNDSGKDTKKYWQLTTGLALVILVLLYIFTGGVSVEVIPRTENLTLEGESFVAVAGTAVETEEDERQTATTSPSDLSFQTVVASTSATTTAPLTETTREPQRASGKLTVYNTYTSEPQQIVDNTRFRSPEGRIYKAREAFTIPGRSGEEPGKITVTVSADETGRAYNFTDVGATFTIPGFEGQPALFDGFYAEVTTPLDGGQSGASSGVSEANREKAVTEVSESMSVALRENIQTKLAEELLLLNGATTTTFQTDVGPAEAEEAVVRVTGVRRGVALSKQALAAAVADRLVSPYEGEPLEAQWNGVRFSLASSTDASQPAQAEFSASSEAEGTPTELSNFDFEAEQIQFVLNGETTLRWTVPERDIRGDLSGKSESSFTSVMDRYRQRIESADVIMRPFWRDEFPVDPQEIAIEVIQ